MIFPPLRATALACIVLLAACSRPTPEAHIAVEATPIVLFDGHSLRGWHADVPEMDSGSVQSPFLVRDSLLVSMGKPEGHLITDSVYRNYVLNLEYRFVGEPGNCGVLVPRLHTTGFVCDVSQINRGTDDARKRR